MKIVPEESESQHGYSMKTGDFSDLGEGAWRCLSRVIRPDLKRLYSVMHRSKLKKEDQ